LKGRERMGSSLLPAELARRDSVLFEKMKCIFSIAPVGNLEKSRECSPDVGPEAPDAVSVRPVCRLPSSARVRHRTQAGVSSVLSPVSARFALLPGSKSGEHRTVRCSASGDRASLQTSLSFSPMCIGRVRCQLRSVRCSTGYR